MLEVFFFFQAEDGIRDGRVTGVQTCALPIWQGPCRRAMPWSSRPAAARRVSGGPGRSEERRVGKSVDLGGRRIIKKKKQGKRRRGADERGKRLYVGWG